MHSIFDNEFLGKPCVEQHMREIREEIEAEQLARQVQARQLSSGIDLPQVWLHQQKVLFTALVGKAMTVTGRVKRGQDRSLETL